MTRRLPLLPLLALLLLATHARADGLIIVSEPVAIPDRAAPPTVTPLHVEEHRVAVTIEDQVATTSVDQTFYNPTGQRLEGTYLFPLPAGAAIDRFTMDIDGKEMAAELLDADKARAIYEEIVRKARDPALMEYVGRGALKVRVFPIEPNSRKRIQLKYTQLLKADAGTVRYMYPLNTEKFSSAPLRNVAVKVELRCSDPIKSVFSPSHAVEVTRKSEREATVGFEAKDVKPDTDFELYFTPQPGDAAVGLTLLTYRDGKADPLGSDAGYFLLLASPGFANDAARVLPKDIVFVLDTSGSMAEGGKLEQAKRALRFCVTNLNDADRFEIIRFSTEAQPLFGGLADANPGNRDKARAFLDTLKPIGGTAIHDALTASLQSLERSKDDPHHQGRPRFVVFLTDGRPTLGQTNEDTIVADLTKRAADQDIRLFSFGVGTDVNTHLLDKLTEIMRGYTTYVLPEEDLELKLSGFYGRIAAPVLANVKLGVTGDGVELQSLYPRPAEMPDLFRGDQLVVAGRYTGSGAATLQLTGRVNGEVRTFERRVELPADDAVKHAFLPRLWATRRVGYLLDALRLHGETKEIKDEVTQLARHYGIVTPFTSYLILEDEAARGVPVAQRSLRELEATPAAAGTPAPREAFADMATAKSGRPAVTSAASNGMLKSAGQADAYRAANAAAEPGSGKLYEQGASQTRFVNGRAFFQNGSQWVDTQVQAVKDARPVQVRFNSPEYFELARRGRDVSQWLSVGRSVQLVLDGVVYEIVDES